MCPSASVFLAYFKDHLIIVAKICIFRVFNDSFYVAGITDGSEGIIPLWIMQVIDGGWLEIKLGDGIENCIPINHLVDGILGDPAFRFISQYLIIYAELEGF
jgi:hypothetical protein